MSPLTVFLRTLAKSTAIFLGAGVIFLNPTLDLVGSRAVTAQKSPAEAAADVLIGALKDSDAGVRRQAAHSLGQMRSARAVPALIDAMKDENAEVRAQAMWALAEVEDRRATPAIAAALKDSDPKVRARAASALAEFEDPAALDALIARRSRQQRRRAEERHPGARSDRRRARAAGADRSHEGCGRLSPSPGHPRDRGNQRRRGRTPWLGPSPPDADAQPDAYAESRTRTPIRIQTRIRTRTTCGTGGRPCDHLLLAGLMAFGPATALDQLRPVRELSAGLTADDATVRARAACELKEHGDAAADAVDASSGCLATRRWSSPPCAGSDGSILASGRPRPATWPRQPWSPWAAGRCRR